LTILHIVRQSSGGIKKHVASLIEALAPDYYQILASSEGLYSILSSKTKQRVISIPLIIGDQAGITDILSGIRLGRMAREKDTRIIHCHGYIAAVAGIAAAKVSNAALIVTAHNLFPKSTNLSRAVAQFVLKKASRIIAVSNAVKESLISTGVPSRQIIVIPNGINSADFNKMSRDEARKLLNINPSSEIVLCASRLTKDKGIEYLIKAASLLAKSKPEIKFIIAGEGPDRKKLEAKARELCGNQIVFLGYRDDISILLAASDATVLPSLSEGLPMFLLESMAAGKAVVASSVGGIPDILEDGKNGILVAPADEKALAAGIERVLSSPQLSASLGEAARRLVENEFTIERMVDRTKEVYRCATS